MQHLTRDDLLNLYAYLHREADDSMREQHLWDASIAETEQLIGRKIAPNWRGGEERAAKLNALAAKVLDEWRAAAD